MKSPYARIFALVKHIKQFDTEYTYRDAVLAFTEGKTNNLSDVPFEQIKYLEIMLQNMAGKQKTNYASDPHDKQRKAIIAIFKSHGKTVEDAKAWTKKQGVKGIKKGFNEYNGQELFALTRQAEKFLRK